MFFAVRLSIMFKLLGLRFSDAINLVAMFIDPLLDGSVRSGQWDPHSGSWVKSPADSERA